MNKKKCRKDYSPQNHPSKYISFRCPSFKLEWVSDIAAYGLISQTNMDVQELLAS